MRRYILGAENVLELIWYVRCDKLCVFLYIYILWLNFFFPAGKAPGPWLIPHNVS